MIILETPVSTMSCLQGRSLPESSKRVVDIGRATSQKSLGGGSNLVFEKDGSGTAYSQNLHFRLNRSDLDLENKMISQLWKSLVTCRDYKIASSFLCRKLHDTLNFNFVYVMEIRVVEPYRIASELLPLENKINAEGFTYMSNLKKTGEENINTRILGSHGFNSDSLKLEPLIHYQAFVSEFGIVYKSHESGIKFKSGVCMPIYKRDTSIVRRRPVTLSTKIIHGTPVDVFLRSGGFLIAAFNEDVRPILDSVIDDISQTASVLRQVYLMS